MISIENEEFIILLKASPLLLIGKELIYHSENGLEKKAKIEDISVSGDVILFEFTSSRLEWIEAVRLKGKIILNIEGFPYNRGTPFTVSTLLNSIDRLEKSIGQPGSDQTKPLFEIVAALNKEIFELKLKIKEMEKNYDLD